MSRQAKLIYIIFLGLFFAAGLWIAQQSMQQEDTATATSGLGGEFVLSSIDGEVRLSDYQGKLVALYFGFLSCPDACPTALASMAAAIRSLDPKQQDQIQPLFISVDPERDSFENMAAYTAYFYPTMKGLTGDLDYLEKLTKQYGAYFRHIPLADSALAYTVDHTSRIYLIDQQGKLLTTIPHNTSATDIALQLQQNL